MEAVQRMIQRANKLGCPRNQVENFLSKQYVPLPWQWEFHALAREADSEESHIDKIGVGGARGPGKSHAVFAQITLDDCQRVPGLKCLFLRQTGTAAQESFEDLISKVVTGKVAHDYIGHTLHFPNGSRILMGGFYREQDVSKYVGIEYDLIAVEELNQLTKRKLDLLLGSMRTSKPNWRPRLYASFNPGGIGHELVKSTFVTPHKKKDEEKTRFIPSTYLDNPHLNKGYIEYLESLDGDLGRAWRDGDFDVFEGQAFSEWRDDKHVVNNFDYPLEQCTRIISFDWGYRDKGVASWLAFTPENRWGVRRCYLYRQLVQTETDPETWAKQLATYCSIDKVKYMVLPPDTFAHKESRVTIASTIEDALKPHRVSVVRADASPGSRISRKAITHMFFSDAADGKPYFQSHEACTDFNESIKTLQYDTTNVEDIAPGDDHSWDSAFYGVVYFVKSNPGFIIKQDIKSNEPKAWTAQSDGTIKPTEDVLDAVKRGMQKGNRSWQT